VAEYIKAVVVFSAKRRPILFGRKARSSPWLRLLKPGFTHCFVTILTDAGWIAVDPLGRTIKIGWSGAASDLSGRSLCRIYTEKGLTAAVYLLVKPGRHPLLPLPATCTEIVRRFLGLPPVFTPWGLYRRLARHPGTIHRTGPPI